MNEEEHICNLGKLVSYFHTLEFLIRSILKNNEQDKPNTNYSRLKKGQTVPEDSMTNYDPLGGLIEKYNKLVSKELKITKDIVEIRDAIAHGRVFSDNPNLPMMLVKFNKPEDGRVSVTFAAKMDRQWFTEKKYQILQEIEKALVANEKYS